MRIGIMKMVTILMVTSLLTVPFAQASIVNLTSESVGSSLPGDFYDRLPFLSQPANAPELDNVRGWKASHLLVGGSDAYINGEYLYQDFLYDDHGASNNASLLTAPAKFHYSSGGIQYPTNDEKYGQNSGDLFEFRVRTDKDYLYYRVSLTTMLQQDASVVTIGINTSADQAKDVSEWPYLANFSQDLGIDTYITAWGIGGAITTKAGNQDLIQAGGTVLADLERNQIEIKIPKTALNPDSHTWRHWVATGAWDGDSWAQVLPIADASHLGGGTSLTPSILNLGFRFNEPFINQPTGTEAFGSGFLRDHDQAKALQSRNIEQFHQDIDFAKLDNRVTEIVNKPVKGALNRIFASRYRHGEGVQDVFPEYKGALQQYMVYIPENYSEGTRSPLALWLHSLDSGANQYAVGNPNLLNILGEKHGFIVATAMARGHDGWYWESAELDVLEMWEDIGRNYQLDPTRTMIGGYSMGGYAAYKFGSSFPDWFARAISVVGPAGVTPGNPPIGEEQERTSTYHLVDNYRNLPFFIQHGTNDELVPVTGVTAQNERMRDLGYRVKFALFPGQDHFSFSSLDSWELIDKELNKVMKIEDYPRQVTFKYFPAHDNPMFNIKHNKAYWLDQIELSDTSSPLPIGKIDAVSYAIPKNKPTVLPVSETGIDGTAYVLSGQEWVESYESVVKRNQLDLDLENIKQFRLSFKQAGLNLKENVLLRTKSDQITKLSLSGAPKVKAILIDNVPVEYTQNVNGDLQFPVPAGSHSILIVVQ
jgi:dienelactone hydrolase